MMFECIMYIYHMYAVYIFPVYAVYIYTFTTCCFLSPSATRPPGGLLVTGRG